jgi:hypothetical protein
MEQQLCQSCAMPMTSQEHFGTEKNGSLSNDYCSYCYKDGQFSSPDQTMEQMIETCIPFIVQQGMDESEARKSMLAIMPGLKRWKN